MPGPPRSGYCGTCRRRRVKCDKGQPACQRCLRSGHRCLGYDTSLRMQNYTVAPDGTGIVLQTPTSSSAGPAIIPLFSAPERENQLPAELGVDGFRDEIAVAHFYSSFGWAPYWRPLLGMAIPGLLATVNETSCLAISTGYMGNQFRNAQIQARGRSLYGRTLRAVQNLLNGGDKQQVAASTVAVLTMGMYNYAVDSHMGLVHHTGLEKIMLHCGPNTFQEEVLLQVFRSCRLSMACQGITTRRRVFLEEVAWKTIPWQRLPRSSDDYLVDILVDLPGLSADMEDPTKRKDAARKVAWLSQKLDKWRIGWDAANGSAARIVSAADSGLDATELPVLQLREVLSTVLTFQWPGQAVSILMYDALVIYISKLATVSLLGSLPGQEPFRPAELGFMQQKSDGQSEPLLLPGQPTHVCQSAIEALRIIPHLGRQLVDSGGAIQLEAVIPFTSIGIVYWCLVGQPEFRHHVDGILRRLPVFHNAASLFAGYKLVFDKSPELRE